MRSKGGYHLLELTVFLVNKIYLGLLGLVILNRGGCWES